jgi:drug/metabolite transporter (DMT)-like permease
VAAKQDAGFAKRLTSPTMRAMSVARLFSCVALALLAFAGNSLLCRLALKNTTIDAATFTTVRLVSGAVTLWCIVQLRARAAPQGNWMGALALFAYAATFSLAYLHLPAGTGALLLFGAVQASMLCYGLLRGERLSARQLCGLLLALGGLIALLLPGVSAPPLASAMLMISAGIAWGAYSLLGRKAADPLRATAGNFLRTVPLTLAFSVASLHWFAWDTRGVLYAIASGAITSGIGYAIWYGALPHLKAMQAATVQLAVPAIAALGGIVLLGEAPTLRLLLCALAILGGIALVLVRKAPGG